MLSSLSSEIERKVRHTIREALKIKPTRLSIRCPKCGTNNTVVEIKYRGETTYSCVRCMRYLSRIEVDKVVKYTRNQGTQSSNRRQALAKAIRDIKRKR